MLWSHICCFFVFCFISTNVGPHSIFFFLYSIQLLAAVHRTKVLFYSLLAYRIKFSCAHRIYFECTRLFSPTCDWKGEHSIQSYANVCMWCAPMSIAYLIYTHSMCAVISILSHRLQRGVFYFEIRTRNRITNIHFTQKEPSSPTIYTQWMCAPVSK